MDELSKVGPNAKQILNYSYPPLLYQRGEDDEDDGEDFNEEEEQDLDDEDAVRDILEGADGHHEQLPEFEDEDGEYGDEEPGDLDDQEIQVLLRGGVGNEADIYRQIQHAVKQGDPNNVFNHNLMEDEEDEDYGIEGEEA